MKINFQDIGQLDDADPQAITRAVIVPAKEGLRQIRQAMTGNLTIRDNMYAAVVTFGTSITPITSGTEWTFQNPLKTKPIGFTPITATNTNGTPIDIPTVKLNTARADGLTGVLARFAWEGPYLEAKPASQQSMTTGAAFPVTWDGASVTDGSGVITIASNASGPASTRLKVSENGIYLLSGQTVWSVTTAGIRETWSIKNNNGSGSGDTRGYGAMTPVAGDSSALVFAFEIPLVANDYIEVFAFQNSGAALTLGNPAASWYSRVQMKRTGPNANAIIVTGILWGG